MELLVPVQNGGPKKIRNDFSSSSEERFTGAGTVDKVATKNEKLALSLYKSHALPAGNAAGVR
jgi:hypothetical protein